MRAKSKYLLTQQPTIRNGVLVTPPVLQSGTAASALSLASVVDHAVEADFLAWQFHSAPDRQKTRIFAVNFKNLFCVGNLTHRPRALMYRREDSWRVELLLGQVDRVLFAGYWEVNHQRLLGNTHCKL
jgi:hypothetical protein